MIPRVDIDTESDIPAGATFWTPKPEDIGDEGFGFFQNLWPILDVSEREAAEVIDAERIAVAFADSGSSDEREFEDLAKAIEDEYPDSLSDEAPTFMSDSGWGGLENLELGVAGLVYALAACGVFPAASCRSHHNGMHSWSEYPVVMLRRTRYMCKNCIPSSKPTAVALKVTVPEATCCASMRPRSSR